MQRIEEEDEGDEADAGEEGEVLESVWHKVNDDVTLSQADLCAINSGLHWAWESQGTRWNDVELKQILGHALLRLEDDKYHQLDLKDVITRLCDERDEFTKRVKLHAERHREHWVVWVLQLERRYLEMCAKDKKSVLSLRFVTISQLTSQLGWLNSETMS